MFFQNHKSLSTRSRQATRSPRSKKVERIESNGNDPRPATLSNLQPAAGIWSQAEAFSGRPGKSASHVIIIDPFTPGDLVGAYHSPAYFASLFSSVVVVWRSRLFHVSNHFIHFTLVTLITRSILRVFWISLHFPQTRPAAKCGTN